MSDHSRSLEQLCAEWTAALAALDRAGAMEVGRRGLRDVGPAVFGDRVITPALKALGEQWERGERSLAEVYMAGRISAALLEQGRGDDADAPIAIALLDDFHGLGKSLVLMALRASGIAVRDYGTLSAEALAERAHTDGVGLLFVSALMLRSALRVEALVAALRARGSAARVVVGGAPFRMDESLWQRVGADGYGREASDAIAMARAFLEEGA